MNLDKLKNSYLTHIMIFVDSQNNDKHLLRTFIDNWFAYYKKPPFFQKIINLYGSIIQIHLNAGMRY